MNQPTPDEFSRFHVRSKLIGDVVKTRHGQYFNVQNYDTLRIWKTGLNTLLALVLVILGALSLFNYLPEYSMMPTLLLDFILAAAFLLWLLPRLLYRFASFRFIPPESHEHLIASETKFPKRNNPLASVALGLVLLAVFLHSFTFQYIRSLIDDDPRMISVGIYADAPDETTLWYTDDFTDSAPASVQVDDSFFRDELDLNVTFSRTDDLPMRLSADGQPFAGFVSREVHFNWFWQDDYFHQTYSFTVYNISEFRDGSTLTLTCGDLHQEWVIEMADEEES